MKEKIDKEIRDAIEVIVTGPVDQNIVSYKLHSPWAAIVGFDKAAAKILELCDADKYDALEVQDATWHDIEDKHLADLATAQAQVAVMAAALEYTLVRLEPLAEALPNIRKPEPWIKKLKKALSAAPKVRWSGEAMVQMNYNLYLGAEGQEAVKGHRKLDVIVLDKQGEGE